MSLYLMLQCKTENWPVRVMVKDTSSCGEVWGLITGQVKSDAVEMYRSLVSRFGVVPTSIMRILILCENN